MFVFVDWIKGAEARGHFNFLSQHTNSGGLVPPMKPFDPSNIDQRRPSREPSFGIDGQILEFRVLFLDNDVLRVAERVIIRFDMVSEDLVSRVQMLSFDLPRTEFMRLPIRLALGSELRCNRRGNG